MENNVKNDITDQEANILWEWLLHKDNLFTNRANFFLVAESFLFAAFATLCTKNFILSLVIIAVGIAISGIWWYISSLQLRRIEKIKKELDKVKLYAKWKEITERNEDNNKDKNKDKRIHKKLGVWLPIIFIAAWITLLILIMSQINCFCFHRCCNICIK